MQIFTKILPSNIGYYYSVVLINLQEFCHFVYSSLTSSETTVLDLILCKQDRMSFFLYLLHDPVSDQQGSPFVFCVYGGDYPLN